MAAAGHLTFRGGERLQGMGIKQPFEKIVADHGATVLRVCRVLLAGPDADDAWSETFLAALRAYPGLPETANIEAWLVTIAHRKAIDMLRARRRHPIPVTDLPEGPATAGGPGTGDSGLWQAVRELPDKQQQAVAYHYVAGLPYAEIAEILGGTTDAAHRAAADGMRNLRKNYPGGGPS
jgi:DNA-directed RNA polymerase specialized sigma24 family protein